MKMGIEQVWVGLSTEAGITCVLSFQLEVFLPRVGRGLGVQAGHPGLFQHDMASWWPALPSICQDGPGSLPNHLALSLLT